MASVKDEVSRMSMQKAVGWGWLFAYFPMDYAMKLQISQNKQQKFLSHNLIVVFP